MKGFLNIENICNVIHFDKSLFIIQMLTQMQAKVLPIETFIMKWAPKV